MGPFDVMDAGRMAVVIDPTGAIFALWQHGSSIGAGIVNEPGSWCWNELGTSDSDAAGKFYSGLFGWASNVMEYGPMVYTVFMNGEKPMGGMYKLTPEMGNIPSNWMVYFSVDDCDKSVAKGRIVGGARNCASNGGAECWANGDASGSAGSVLCSD